MRTEQKLAEAERADRLLVQELVAFAADCERRAKAALVAAEALRR